MGTEEVQLDLLRTNTVRCFIPKGTQVRILCYKNWIKRKVTVAWNFNPGKDAWMVGNSSMLTIWRKDHFQHLTHARGRLRQPLSKLSSIPKQISGASLKHKLRRKESARCGSTRGCTGTKKW